MAQDLIFHGQFIDADDLDGETGLTVTIDVYRTTISDGSTSQVVTGGSCTETGGGIYRYRYASADLSLYHYVANMKTASADVAQKHVACIGMVVPGVAADPDGVPDVNVTHSAGVALGGRLMEAADEVIAYVRGVRPTASAALAYPTGVVTNTDGTTCYFSGTVGADDLTGWLMLVRSGDYQYFIASVESQTSTTELVFNRTLPALTFGTSVVFLPVDVAKLTQQEIRDAGKLAPTAGDPEAGSVDKHLDDLLATTAACASVAANSTDATASGAITRKRGNSWSIALTLGNITGYTSLWFSVKRSYDDADSAALLQVKLNAPSAADGLLYVNGAAATNAAKGSIIVSDAGTGAIVVVVDETITDDLAPGTYYYDAQVLIEDDVTTPDSGTFTITADVTRSVA